MNRNSGSIIVGGRERYNANVLTAAARRYSLLEVVFIDLQRPIVHVVTMHFYLPSNSTTCRR